MKSFMTTAAILALAAVAIVAIKSSNSSPQLKKAQDAVYTYSECRPYLQDIKFTTDLSDEIGPSKVYTVGCDSWIYRVGIYTSSEKIRMARIARWNGEWAD